MCRSSLFPFFNALFRPSKQNNKIDFDKPKIIQFEGDSYYISNRRFNIIDISVIYYGVSSLTDENPIYYIKLLSNENSLERVLDQDFELGYADSFINIITSYDIPLLPTISTNSGVYVVKGYALSLNYECYVHEKYLVSIYFNDLDKYFFKNISIVELLERPKKYTSLNNEVEFNIKILSDKLTLNRGYGLFPMLNNEIIIKNIFYSFDEKEIKDKIKELFERYKP